MSPNDLSRLFTIALFGVPVLVVVGALLLRLALHGFGRPTSAALGCGER